MYQTTHDWDEPDYNPLIWSPSVEEWEDSIYEDEDNKFENIKNKNQDGTSQNLSRHGQLQPTAAERTENNSSRVK